MREWLRSEYRRLGPRKIAIVSVAIVIVVVLAYGDNVGNSSAHVRLRASSVSAALAPASRLGVGS
jgi:hypothetical protein